MVREALVSLSLRSAGAGTGAVAGGAEARGLLAAWSAGVNSAPSVALPPLTALLHAFAHAPTASKKVCGPYLFFIISKL